MEELQKQERRSFLKKAVGVSAVAATTSLVAKDDEPLSSGVVRGKSKKKEVLYKLTPEWEKFYKVAY